MNLVLVIDDERVIRDLMREILERAGYRTVGASTADEAFDALEQHDVSLVVSDIVMPQLTGLELLDEVHARRPDVPVILVTGEGTYENLSQAVTRGADGFVIKPFSHADLQNAVASALERARLRTLEPISMAERVAELRAGRGSRWDPTVVDAALDAIEDGRIRFDGPTNASADLSDPLAGGATPMIRVVVVDDHPAVRIGLADFLDAQDGFEIVGQAENGAQAVELSRSAQPDVVVMDIRMPELDGIEATRQIKAASPRTGVLLLTAYEEDDLASAGRAAGADGFYLKGIFGAELVDRVREVNAA